MPHRASSASSPIVIDLDGILSQYTGNAIIDRLLCIAETTTSADVARDALRKTKEAIERGGVDEFSKPKTSNGVAYTRAKSLAETLKITDVDFTDDWLHENNARARAELAELDKGLSEKITERVNENIRMQFVELGDHYYDRGDLKNALAYYSRTRDYCSTPKHILFMCLRVMAVCIEMNNFAHVGVHATKAHRALDDMADGDDESVLVSRAKVFCACGIANLRLGRYKDAANDLSSIPVEISTSYASVCSARDVALYGALCALATYNRTELRDIVLNNKKNAFRAHLEAASDVREIVNTFFESKYTTLFTALERLRPWLEHDLHLREHITSLYKRIRDRALIQYCEPYISVDLEIMASAFNTTSLELQREIATLIENEKISGRIDSQHNTLTSSSTNARADALEHILADGEMHEQQTRSALLRLSLLRNDVVVRANGVGAKDDDAGVKPSRISSMDVSMSMLGERKASN
jgi:COP9 signalosome complex subunit 1|mmetsp:Transcript_4563/g.15131  ORF Transcript_4563/g.15131 Transcript_4563/m.15131 type:complete len:470 (+) Transcript_4563:119-1528(+)